MQLYKLIKRKLYLRLVLEF